MSLFRCESLLTLLFSTLTLISSFSTLSGCAHQSSKNLPFKTTTSTASPAFVSHKDWIGLPLAFEPFNELRQNLEKKVGHSLQNRGEAHITILTPPEFKTLNVKGELKMEDIEKLILADLRNTKWEPICVGSGAKMEAEKQLATFFVVVRAPELYRLREKISAAYPTDNNAFDPAHFYPHITLGYTDRDLHEQDGVIKNQSSCVFEIQETP